jgi:hypothetical protein
MNRIYRDILARNIIFYDKLVWMKKKYIYGFDRPQQKGNVMRTLPFAISLSLHRKNILKIHRGMVLN